MGSKMRDEGRKNNNKVNNSNNKNGNRKKNTKKRANPFTRIMLIVLSVIIFSTVAVSAYVYSKYGGFIGDVIGIVNDVRKDKIQVKDPITVLVLGLDIGDTEQIENEEIKRTDTMLLVHYNPTEQQCEVVSIPRDTKFRYGTKSWKINSAYPLGGEELVKSTVEDMLDISIDNVVKVDYAGFRALIDAIGGIDMYIEQDMFYDDNKQNLHINFKGGETVHLDGKKAEEFFRWRKNNDGTGLALGDLDRIENQQKLIEKVVEKLMSPSIIPHIGDIIQIIDENLETDLELETIVSYGMSFIKMDLNNIEMCTLPGESKYMDDLWYFIYDKEQSKELISKLRDEDDLSNLPVSRDSLKIMIYNCTKVNGLAGATQRDLYDMGYTKVDVGNGKETEETEIFLKNDNARILIKNDLKINNINLGISEKIDSTQEYDVVVFLGKDYKKIGEIK